MERHEAIAKVKGWADELEADIEAPYFSGVIDQLVMPVKNERLEFIDGIFKYKLFTPIEKKEGEKIELVSIQELTMQDTKIVERYKDKEAISSSIALLAKVCGIELGFATRLKHRDIAVINAVNLGFFVRSSPERTA